MHENRKNIDEFLNRHQRYAELEAREMLRGAAERRQQRSGRLLGSWPDRRRALKTGVWYRLPARPLIRFVWMFVVRRGFLDGYRGLVYCQLLAAYEAMIDAKVMERKTQLEAPTIESNTRLRDILVCPSCGSDLQWSPSEIVCEAASHTFDIVDGVPILLADGDLDGTSHKHSQALFFDAGDGPAEFELRRPHGTPRLHRWVLDSKFDRSISEIESILPGSVAVAVCGGSGMESEYLARSGASVITADISLGAARRALERARERALPVLSIVADAERLPLRDRSVDLAYVHDGLHHLEDPMRGVAEMARVSDRMVSITEPAVAAATGLAVHVGLAQEEEEAGNRVGRMRPHHVAASLRRFGFRSVVHRRYAIFYRHVPGPAAKFFSLPVAYTLARFGWAAFNACFAAAGNKLNVQAVRQDGPRAQLDDATAFRSAP